MEPPEFGWIACCERGIQPPPRLVRMGMMLSPPGNKYHTIEDKLIQWEEDNNIIELLRLSTTVDDAADDDESIYRHGIANRMSIMCEHLSSLRNRIEEVGQMSRSMRSWLRRK
jgi:hypothetical protein